MRNGPVKRMKRKTKRKRSEMGNKIERDYENIRKKRKKYD